MTWTERRCAARSDAKGKSDPLHRRIAETAGLQRRKLQCGLRTTPLLLT